MRRALFAITCLLSLLLASAAAVVTVHSRRAWHGVVWRTDPAAEAEGAHTSLAGVWREASGAGVPGFGSTMGEGKRARPVVVQAPTSALAVVQARPPAPQQREYASLVLADGVLEFRRYPEPPCFVPM